MATLRRAESVRDASPTTRTLEEFMPLSIDKSLPVALQTQIVGAIEYGIMAGEFFDNGALPSVRALSKQLGVAQLTVSQAYNTLKRMGLIETIPGKGTYVVRDRREVSLSHQVEALHERFRQLVEEASTLGLSPSFFVGALNHPDAGSSFSLNFPIGFVGNSRRINRRYLEAIGETLGVTLSADVWTFQEFAGLSQCQIDSYDFWLTIPHCIPRLRQRLTEEVPVYAPWLIPSETTRTRLAALPVDTPVLLVSRYQTFISAMVEGVKNFAPHLGKISVITLDDKRLAETMARFQTVIYSTGCHSVIQRLPATNILFEYQHTPEPRYLREVLLPALHRQARELTEGH
jgi:DNA-binding transcriptional regulator YhcF (GntR family)